MNNCYGCKYYDDSVDACNADDKCYMDGYEKGTAKLKEFCDSCIHKVSADDIKAIKNSVIDECIEALGNNIWDIAKLEQLKE